MIGQLSTCIFFKAQPSWVFFVAFLGNFQRHLVEFAAKFDPHAIIILKPSKIVG